MFLLSNEIKYFLDTLIQKILFLVTKVKNLRGDLTDVSAIKEALLLMLWLVVVVRFLSNVLVDCLGSCVAATLIQCVY